MMPLPLQFLVVLLAGWLCRHQQEMIEYLQEENRVPRDQLGYEVVRNTIKRVLAANGIDPVGFRPIAWKTFLRAHWGAIAATDFFTVEVVTWRGLVRYFVLFVIDLKSRCVEIAGITAMPNGEWIRQVAAIWSTAKKASSRTAAI